MVISISVRYNGGFVPDIILFVFTAYIIVYYYYHV